MTVDEHIAEAEHLLEGATAFLLPSPEIVQLAAKATAHAAIATALLAQRAAEREP
jgi:hypothetical protein